MVYLFLMQESNSTGKWISTEQNSRKLCAAWFLRSQPQLTGKASAPFKRAKYSVLETTRTFCISFLFICNPAVYKNASKP